MNVLWTVSFCNIFVVPLITIYVLNKLAKKEFTFGNMLSASYFLSIVAQVFATMLVYLIADYHIDTNQLVYTLISIVLTVCVYKLWERFKQKNSVEFATTVAGRKRIVFHIVTGLIYILCVLLIHVVYWSTTELKVGLNAIIYTLTSPLEGNDGGLVARFFGGYTLSLVLTLIPCVIFMVYSLTRRNTACLTSHKVAGNVNALTFIRRIWAVFCCGLFITTIFYSDRQYQVAEYIMAQFEHTTIYEDYYVSPDSVNITPAGDKPKNLLCIYMESMEITYADKDNGGNQDTNLIPNLTQLAEDNISFSNSMTLGGYRPYEGTDWTIAALFATSSGLPFAFPRGIYDISEMNTFASGVTTIGDILSKYNYNQMFLCGSDGDFAARRTFFEEHGGFSILDYYAAIDMGYLPADYHEWWGYEDRHLYDIAKSELTKLASKDKPFNLTMLTVDTHFPDGYECPLCPYNSKVKAANVVNCADTQLAGFIDWCKEQDFYKDTVIVIIGDHPRMDTVLVEDVEYKNRTMYNCFINSFADTDNIKRNYREWASMDVFPTILGAMGYKIEGDRLGLGTNMFSDRKTLSEELGFEWLNEELLKKSDYYINTFR